MLVNNLRQRDFFVVIVDEVFKNTLQREQMDILVRFWRAGRVVTRYLCSPFQGSLNAGDLLKASKVGIGALDLARFIQEGMDCPNVN